MAVEGLATPENLYSPFVQHYLDYPSWLRSSLLHATKWVVGLLGHDAMIPDNFHVKFVGGRGVQLIYACLGVGVSCFWLAFVVANKGTWLKKTYWVLGGILAIWIINVTRISLFLISVNNNTKMPLGMDNHDFFDVLAYIAIFGLMFLYDRSGRKVERMENV